MQFFRSQLSRFIPHPHRDSWMRNNLDNWLYLLRLTTFLTLVAAGCFVIFFDAPSSPIGQELDIHQTISSTLSSLSVPAENLAQATRYTRWSLGSFLLISGLLSFRCGEKEKTKYMLPVFTSFLILLGCLLWLLHSQNYHPYVAVSYIIPVTCPLALLLYRKWQNKLDHWNYFLITILLLTAIGYASGMYNEDSTIVSDSIIAFMDRLGLDALLTVKLMKILSLVGLGAGLLLFAATTRRIALIAFIIIAGVHLVIRLASHISSDLAFYGFDYWIIDFFFHISFIMYPVFVLLSLASRRKTQTLRL